MVATATAAENAERKCAQNVCEALPLKALSSSGQSALGSSHHVEESALQKPLIMWRNRLAPLLNLSLSLLD